MTPLLFNAPVGLGPWLLWGATHQSDHFQIISGILNATGQTVGVLPIDPVPIGNREQMMIWFMNHQEIHNQMNAAMGTGGFDLSFVDLQNPEEARIWLQYNALEHQAIAYRIATFQPPQTSQGQPTFAIQPQPFGVQPVPQGSNALLPQGLPGVQTIISQPQAGTQVQPQGGMPQAPLQPFPTLQPQPGQSPQAPLNPGTPLQAGGGLVP